MQRVSNHIVKHRPKLMELDLKVKILENFLESITKREKHLYDWWNWDLKSVQQVVKEMRSSNPKYDKTRGVFLGLSTP